MGPCSRESKNTSLWARAAEKVRTRVYGPVWCEKGKNTGLWARVVRERFMGPCGA
ncbi:hypothetical protein CRG98_044133 [Punica granatum]|uniref:Uncharacterized protein n=1 Tax=Punica granatum TaxID=22663 RepID=A0A2I0HW25_PUNGR|nr:hypothetical protein CRG98_044133 [Punica granatum]